MSWTSTRNNAVYRTADVRRKLADRGIALPEGAAAAAANLDRIRATRPVQPEPNAVRDAILNDAEPAEIDRLLLAELAAARRLAAHNQAEIDAATRTLRQIRDGHNEIYPQLKQRADEAIAHIDAVAGLDGASLDALVRDGRHDDAKLLVNVTAAAADSDGAASQRPADVDLVFHGVTPDGVARLCAQLQEHCHAVAAARGLRHESAAATDDDVAAVAASGVAVLLTSRTMTVVFADASLPRLQVALGWWESAADALQTADVDCCCAGFDGSRALVTGRGALAWAAKANVPSAGRHAVRGSPTYEVRLWKYGARHGFAVLDPGHRASEDAVQQARASARAVKKNKTGGAATKDGGDDAAAVSRAEQRRRARVVATSASGLA